jgi:hypothetical protein
MHFSCGHVTTSLPFWKMLETLEGTRFYLPSMTNLKFDFISTSTQTMNELFQLPIVHCMLHNIVNVFTLHPFSPPT